MPEQANIEFQDKSFWIPEGFIEVLSNYLCETFETLGLNNLSENLKRIYFSCEGNKSGEYIGMVNIPLKFLSNQSEKNEMLNIIDQTKILISSKGVEISISTLEQFENNKTDDYFKNAWLYPIKTQSLVVTLNIMKQMIEGTWTSNNYSVYYEGFPNPSGYEEI